jgi:hypothetical protein
MKKTQIAGKLYIPGLPNVYYLLRPRPVTKDTWMRDDVEIFYVAVDGSIARQLVVKGPYVIDYGEAGKEISIKEQEEVEYSDNYSEPEWLKELLMNEPQELADIK